MQLVEFIFLGLFDQIAYLLVSKKLLSSPKIENKRILLFFTTMVLATSMVEYYWVGKYGFMLNMIVYFFFTYYLYGEHLFETLYATIITISIMISIQAGILVVLRLFLSNLEKNFYYGIIAQCIFLLTIIAFTKLPLNSIFEFINKRNRVFIGLIMNGFFLVVVVLFYWNYDIEGFFESVILIGITVIILSSLNFLYLIKGLENEHERARLEVYDRYHRITEDLINDIRARQHEFDNHIQAIKMSKNSFIDMDYIKNLEFRNDLGSLIKLESNLLGGLLYAKKKEAIRVGVDLKINIESFDYFKQLKEYELIDIVGNLLDNAFEAVENYQDKNVYLNFKKEDNQNIIEVRNNYDYLSSDVIEQIFKKGISTKKGNGRGFGLYNVRKVVKKYNGKIEVKNMKYLEQNYIVFKIII